MNPWAELLECDEDAEDQYEICLRHEDCRQDLLMSRCCHAASKGATFAPVPLVTHGEHQPEHTHIVKLLRNIPLGASYTFSQARATKRPAS